MSDSRDDILDVLRDGSRIDRYISAWPGIGWKVTTRNDAEEQIEIPVAHDTTEEEEERWADKLVDQADEALARLDR